MFVGDPEVRRVAGHSRLPVRRATREPLGLRGIRVDEPDARRPGVGRGARGRPAVRGRGDRPIPRCRRCRRTSRSQQATQLHGVDACKGDPGRWRDAQSNRQADGGTDHVRAGQLGRTVNKEPGPRIERLDVVGLHGADRPARSRTARSRGTPRRWCWCEAHAAAGRARLHLRRAPLRRTLVRDTLAPVVDGHALRSHDQRSLVGVAARGAQPRPPGHRRAWRSRPSTRRSGISRRGCSTCRWSTLLGAVRAAIPVYGSGGFTSYPTTSCASSSAAGPGAGLRAVKMKIGREPDAMSERVRAARERDRRQRRALRRRQRRATSRKQALRFAGRFAEHRRELVRGAGIVGRPGRPGAAASTGRRPAWRSPPASTAYTVP